MDIELQAWYHGCCYRVPFIPKGLVVVKATNVHSFDEGLIKGDYFAKNLDVESAFVENREYVDESSAYPKTVFSIRCLVKCR